MSTHIDAYKINGKTLSASELKANLKKTYHADWEKEFWQFIAAWVDPSLSIAAKTSGSTGAPKNILLSKKAMRSSANKTIRFLGLKENQNALLCLPAQYIAGKMMIVRAFEVGMNLHVVAPSENPLLAFPEEIPINFAAFAPNQVHQIVQEDYSKKKFLAIENILIGGSNIGPHLERELRTAPNNIFVSYGMTETMSHVALRKISGAGDFQEKYSALPGVKFSINQDNCLRIEAPDLLEEPLLTKDVVELESETSFYWLGRADNIINSAGIKIAPETVEKKIGTHIHQRFFIAGWPDDKLGEKVVLVLEAGAKDENLLEKIRPLLDRYECPKEIITIARFVETPNGKVNRKKTLATIKTFNR